MNFSSSLLPIVSGVMSVASFGLAGYALWVAQFNHGRLRMTQPTLLCLKRELTPSIPKIFLRTLLFTTGNKGTVIQSMFLRVHHPGGTFTFDFWGHTEGGKLTLGSGLFVGPTGVACDHHFNPHSGSHDLLFVPGRYRIEVFAADIRRARCAGFLARAACAGPDRRHGLGRLGSEIKIPADSPPGSINALT